jgi:hypothetical protein
MPDRCRDYDAACEKRQQRQYKAVPESPHHTLSLQVFHRITRNNRVAYPKQVKSTSKAPLPFMLVIRLIFDHIYKSEEQKSHYSRKIWVDSPDTSIYSVKPRHHITLRQ